MHKTNIVLIGMPGAGKSTIGVLLAKALKMPFIDTDLIIQQRQDKLLQEIIDAYGLQEFLVIEEQSILEEKIKGHVIATGGSVVYSELAINHLKKGGILIYLKLEYDEIERRVNNITSRGVAISKGQSLYGLYKERLPLYEQHADIIINCSHKDIENIVEEIKNVVIKDVHNLD